MLSFAQFEREVTGERIRDKIAASKAKGMWMGGTLPLGYDCPPNGSRALVINEAEAETVRHIFRQYLELGSVHVLAQKLGEDGIVSKRAVARNGNVRGGAPFTRGPLFHLLRNRVYLGMIVHRDTVHPGLHEAIVPVELFDAVQASLDANVKRHRVRREPTARAPFVGRLFDSDGKRMTPAFSQGSNGRNYRYYVATGLQQGREKADGNSPVRRLSAHAFEALVADIVSRTTVLSV